MRFEKNGHTYIVRFQPSDLQLAVATVGCWAASPLVNLTWYDAAVIINCLKSDAKC